MRTADTSAAGALLGRLIMDRRRLTGTTASAANVTNITPRQEQDNGDQKESPRETLRSKPAAEPRIERIARRAHELYEARGGTHGRALEDWLQAEREIDAEL